MKTPVRSAVIRFTAWGCNWLGDHCSYPDLRHPVGWRDHLRWFLEGWLNRIFGAAYEGSADEINDGITWAGEEFGDNWEYLTPLQQEIKVRWPEWIDHEPIA